MSPIRQQRRHRVAGRGGPRLSSALVLRRVDACVEEKRPIPRVGAISIKREGETWGALLTHFILPIDVMRKIIWRSIDDWEPIHGYGRAVAYGVYNDGDDVDSEFVIMIYQTSDSQNLVTGETRRSFVPMISAGELEIRWRPGAFPSLEEAQEEVEQNFASYYSESHASIHAAIYNERPSTD